MGTILRGGRHVIAIQTLNKGCETVVEECEVQNPKLLLRKFQSAAALLSSKDLPPF